MNQHRAALYERYANFRVDVPEGKDGLWEIERYTMTQRDLIVSDAVEQVTRTDRHSLPGTYTKLLRWGHLGNPYNATVFMSDHVCEVADHHDLVEYARQNAPLKHVLINGLGIGVAIELLAPYVEQFTIIELSAAVIRLVAPHYQARYPGRIEVIQHDALTYLPPKGVRYNAVFHDIWATISHTNLAEMRHLHRRYGRLCDWQQSWARVYCEREARKRRRHPEQYKDRVDMREVMQAINTLFAVTGPEMQP